MKLATHLSTSPSIKPDTYIYKILPVAANTALAAISSDDSLLLFDSATLQPLASATQLQGKIHEGVTCLRPFGVGAAADDDGGPDKDGHCVLTAGMDGTVRGWDLRLSGRNFLEIRDRRFRFFLC
jgi:WD40 repeat protein